MDSAKNRGRVDPNSVNRQTILQRPWPGVYHWIEYSAAHRTDLSSTAVHGDAGLIVFDPIPLGEQGHLELCANGNPVAILLTNGNHVRDTAAWQKRYGIPVYAPRGVVVELPQVQWYDPRNSPLPGWKSFSLSGGGPGETAFLLPEGALTVVGDAIINLSHRGLELLPREYCTDPAQLRRSLLALTQENFDYALMAHGEPVRKDASRRISALL